LGLHQARDRRFRHPLVPDPPPVGLGVLLVLGAAIIISVSSHQYPVPDTTLIQVRIPARFLSKILRTADTARILNIYIYVIFNT
jgi:hypothetical protein